MTGQLVCQTHGGKTPQSRQTAEERLKALVHPALNVMTRALDDYATEPALAVRVAQDLLDRAGFKAVSTVQTDGRMIIEVEYVGGKPTIVDVEPVHANGRPLIEFLPEALEE
jgi:hypothetical protein